ncbi:hypothetical protein [Yimella lutea]|nr:hypothetical protein [Yimella lutea]
MTDPDALIKQPAVQIDSRPDLPLGGQHPQVPRQAGFPGRT